MTAGEKWQPGSHFLLHSGLSSASERRPESWSGEGGTATIPHVSRLHAWLNNFISHKLQEEERWGGIPVQDLLWVLMTTERARARQQRARGAIMGTLSFFPSRETLPRAVGWWGQPWVSVGSLGLALRTALASLVRRTHASRGRAGDLLLRLLCGSLQAFPPRGALLPFFLN